MNDVSDHEATMRFLYWYVVRKHISRPGLARRFETTRRRRIADV